MNARGLVRRGMTLVEVLIATVVFGVFLTLAASTLVRCYSYYINNRDVEVNFRDAAVGFDRMSRELTQCRQVYAPDASTTWSEGVTVSPTPGAPFVFAFQQPNLGATPGVGTKMPSAPMGAVGYQLDVKTRTLQRLLYAVATDPTSGSPLSVQAIASPVLSFAVTRVPRADADHALCIKVYATVPGKFRTLPVFFQTQVPEIKDGM